MLNKITNLSLNKKIFFSYIPILLITFVISFIEFSSTLKMDYLREVSSAKVNILKNISDKIDYLNQSMVSISNSYLFDKEIQDFLRFYYDKSPFKKLTLMNKAKETITTQHNIFNNIKFYTTIYGYHDGTYITNNPFSTKNQDDSRVDSYHKLLIDHKSKILWVNQQRYNDNNIITAIRNVVDISSGDSIGMMIFDFEESIFAGTYNKYLDKEEKIMLISSDGTIISSSDTGMIGCNIDRYGNQIRKEINGYKEGYFNLKEKFSMVSFTKNANLDWYVISIAPQNTLLTQYFLVFEDLFLFVIVITILFMLITVFLSRYISYPIKSLVKDLREYRNEEHNLENMQEISKKFGKDEIKYLRYEFKEMNQSINTLINQIVLEQEEKRQLELKTLQNQIKPHFLYNTLHSIRVLNQTGDYERVDQTIVVLVRLLSVIFHDTNDLHTIKNELELLKDYTYIQQVRYGNNFDFEISCCDPVLNYKIPKLILQPIIENSIFHGLSEYEEGGFIKVTIEERNNKLTIKVIDNGVGLINSKKNGGGQEKHGIGIKNVINRLKLYYGLEYSLKMYGNREAGTTVELIIPIN